MTDADHPVPFPISNAAFRPNLEANAVRYDPARRKSERVDCSHRARVSSGNQQFSTSARIVNISMEGAKIEAACPKDVPSVFILWDRDNDNVYECEAMWRGLKHLGVSFIDILSSPRRRLYFAGKPVPLKTSTKPIRDL